MKRTSFFLLILVLSAISAVFADVIDWPVKRAIDLASGFGDYRSGRFHAGVDIRTGGVTGEPVFSPVDGYVWRIRTHYSGYGKVLYIKGEDEHIYVFAHLAKFIPEIQKTVTQTQVTSQRYYTDIYLPKDSIKIKKGQLIAQSGETGAGPPHLHFERRNPDNRPINPLTHGFHIDDETKPIFQRIGFQAADDTSLFDNGVRKYFYNVKRSGAGEYYLDTVVYFDCPFGVLTECYDLMRPNGMKRTVRMVSLYIDDVLYYESVFDTLDYGTEQSSYFEYDYFEAVEDRSKVRRLYSENGNHFLGSRAKNGFRGYFGESVREKRGLRRGKIVAEDCCGNQSTLSFDFIWGEPENIFVLDSTVTDGFKEAKFYFTAKEGFQDFEIDSVAVFRSVGEKWFQPKFAITEYSSNGKLVCHVTNDIIRPLVLQLFVFPKYGGMIKDNLFNGIIEKLPKLPHRSLITVDEEGMWITISSSNMAGARAWVNLYHGDTLLGTHEAKLFNMANYRCFIRAKEEYKTIDRIGMTFHDTPNGDEHIVDSLRFSAVGFGKREVISDDGRLTLKFNENTLYRPMFVQVKNNPILRKVILHLNSDHYEIFPHAFRCRQEFEITYTMPGQFEKNKISGLCWLDKEKNKWVWLDNINENNQLTAKSIGGGSFAAVIDYDPPVISNLNVVANRTYSDPNKTIRFVLRDTLSGIEDDQSILIKLDGEWVIPEYDPESYICTTEPLEPLESGEHHLAIEVWDRAGNKSEQYVKFKIRRSGR